MTRTIRGASLVAALLAGALTLGACGNSDDDAGGNNDNTTSAAAQHNDADVTFAMQMIPHHEQALEMAKMANTSASDQRVKDLAAQIEAAQQPEIDTLTGWLEGWGEPAPESGGHGGHDMDDMGGGMMSDAEMAELGKADGAMFDRMWVEMMISHHQGAVQMAEKEIAAGSDPAAIDLATSIKQSQTAEIEEMQKLVKQLG